MLEKCNNCGFEEKRLTDGKVPLVLDFKDGNRKNHKYDNLQMLCFNVHFWLMEILQVQKKNMNINEFIIGKKCEGVCDTSCVEVCPVDCIQTN